MINYVAAYPGQLTAPDSNYTYGSAKNVSAPSAGDGTPFEQNMQNDIMGLFQALVTDNAIVPSGSPETMLVSQLYDAMRQSVSVYKNVKAFGAVGDGATDDTLAIQAAIDRVDVEGGGGIFFPVGVFISSKLTVGSNTTLMGIGGTLTLKTGSSSALIEVTAGSTNIRIVNLRLDGNAVNNVGTPDTVGLIDLASTGASKIQDVWIDKCIIFDPYRHAIGFKDGSERIHVLNCALEGTSDGAGGGILIAPIASGSTVGILIQGNRITGFEEAGVLGGVVINAQIVANRIGGTGAGSGVDNIHLTDEGNDNLFISENILLLSADHGIVVGGTRCIIQNNNIWGYAVTGIVISATGSADAPSPQCVITGNKVFPTTPGSADGIFVENALGVVVSHNSIGGTGGQVGTSTGIVVKNTGLINTCDYFSVVGNSISQYNAGSILIDGGAGMKNGVVSNNICNGVLAGDAINLNVVLQTVCNSNVAADHSKGVIETGACDFNLIGVNNLKDVTTPLTIVGAGTISPNNLI